MLYAAFSAAPDNEAVVKTQGVQLIPFDSDSAAGRPAGRAVRHEPPRAPPQLIPDPPEKIPI